MTVTKFSPLKKSECGSSVFRHSLFGDFSDWKETDFDERSVNHHSERFKLCKKSLMEHDRFLHTLERKECNDLLHVCGDF
jgi:hypothetical protein